MAFCIPTKLFSRAFIQDTKLGWSFSSWMDHSSRDLISMKFLHENPLSPLRSDRQAKTSHYLWTEWFLNASHPSLPPCKYGLLRLRVPCSILNHSALHRVQGGGKAKSSPWINLGGLYELAPKWSAARAVLRCPRKESGLAVGAPIVLHACRETMHRNLRQATALAREGPQQLRTPHLVTP